MRIGLDEGRILENAGTDEQCSCGQAPATSVRREVYLSGTLPLAQIKRRSGFPGRDDSGALALGWDLGTVTSVNLPLRQGWIADWFG